MEKVAGAELRLEGAQCFEAKVAIARVQERRDQRRVAGRPDGVEVGAARVVEPGRAQAIEHASRVLVTGLSAARAAGEQGLVEFLEVLVGRAARASFRDFSARAPARHAARAVCHANDRFRPRSASAVRRLHSRAGPAYRMRSRSRLV